MPQHMTMTNQDALALGEEQDKIALQKAKKTYAILGIIIFSALPLLSYSFSTSTGRFPLIFIYGYIFLWVFIWGMLPLEWRRSEQLRSALVRWYLYNTPKERAIRLIPVFIFLLVYFGSRVLLALVFRVIHRW